MEHYRTIFRETLKSHQARAIKYKTLPKDKKICGVLVSPPGEYAEVSLVFENRAKRVLQEFVFTNRREGQDSPPGNRTFIFPVPLKGAGTVVTGTIQTASINADLGHQFSIYLLTESDANDQGHDSK